VKQSILHPALVVRNYEKAIAFYTQKLHFTFVEDTYQPEQDKRWVVVAPPGSTGSTPASLGRTPGKSPGTGTKDRHLTAFGVGCGGDLQEIVLFRGQLPCYNLRQVSPSVGQRGSN
jgi:catechol 2,3-dioxygenase-like lactoylglutathione lyase family enzyme